MAYIISIMPPNGMGDRFDVGAESYQRACVTARRYRQRGWQAVIIDCCAEPVAWRMSGTGVDPLRVTARNFDEAIMLARSVDARYDSGQREN